MIRKLTKIQLLVHLKCVEETILLIKAGVYKYGSNNCRFCRAFDGHCIMCTWNVMQHRRCHKAYDNWCYVWKSYRWLTLHWWHYKIKRRLRELES